MANFIRHLPKVRAIASATTIAAILSACGGAGTESNTSTVVDSDTAFRPTAAAASTSAQPMALDCSPKQVVSSGGYSSCNLEWVGRLVIPGTTIGAKLIGNTYYLTNFANGFYAFDVSSPENPQQLSNLRVDLGRVNDGTSVSVVENEDTATNGQIAVLSRTPMNDSLVINNSNPRDMRVLATIPGATAHTYSCIDGCKWVYGSTTGNIIDLRDPANPVLLPNLWSEVTGGITAHDVTEIRPGLVATAANPTSFLDTTNPANPKLIFSLPAIVPSPTDALIGPAQDGPVGHNNIWPRQGQDRFFMALSEGAYDGKCEAFDEYGRTIYLYDTRGWQTTKAFNLISSYTLVSGSITDTINGGGLQGVDSNGNPSTLELGVQGCSVHWFEPNPSFSDGGIVAMASFSHGMRLLKVGNDGSMKQLGYFVPSGLASTVAVHWISDRVLYVLDFINGYMDVVKYTGPLQ